MFRLFGTLMLGAAFLLQAFSAVGQVGEGEYPLAGRARAVEELNLRGMKALEREEESETQEETWKELPELPLSRFEEYVSRSVVAEFGQKVRQFGYDVFRRVPSYSMRAGEGIEPDYVIGPGDEIVVSVWGKVARRFRAEVDREGRLDMGEMGMVSVAGLTFRQLREAIKRTLDRHFVGYEFEVTLARIRMIRVYVVGHVRLPGVHRLPATATTLAALFAAGGPTKEGSMRRIEHRRGGKLLSRVELYDFLMAGSRASDHRLADGDVVLVPVAGALVAVTGAVKVPAIYELSEEKTSVRGLLEMAGGMAFSGSWERVQVEYCTAKGPVLIDLKNAGEADKMKLADGNILRVYPAPEKLANVVFLRGNVIAPRAIAFHKGMMLSDLLSNTDLLVLAQYWARRKSLISARSPAEQAPTVQKAVPEKRPPESAAETVPKEVLIVPDPEEAILPEPCWDYALLKRIEQPSLREKYIPFNLRAVLVERDPEADIPLQPQDAVIVFAASDFDAGATVSVYGAVKRPGTYRLSPGLCVRDLIRLAGGLAHNALLRSAELTRHDVSGEKCRTLRVDVDLASVLPGGGGGKSAKAANIELRRSDSLLVRFIPESGRYGVVTVSGEVVFPGTYSLERGEKLSSVLKRAGAFTDSAYLYGTALFRESVRLAQQEQLNRMITRLEVEAGLTPQEKSIPQDRREMADEVTARRNALIARLREVRANGRVVVEFGPPEEMEGTEWDIEVEPGDRIEVPRRPASIAVTGAVFGAGSMVHREGLTVLDCIEACGGFSTSSDRREVYVLRADGTVRGPRSENLGGVEWISRRRQWVPRGVLSMYPKHGDTIVVPEKIEPKLYPGRLAKDIVGILYQVAVSAGVIIAVM